MMFVTLAVWVSVLHVFWLCVVVIERPMLTAGPTNATGVKEHESVHFECHFNGSLIPY